MTVTDHGKQLANHLVGLIDADPEVERSQLNEFTADLLVFKDRPQAGVTTLASVNLSDKSATLDGYEQDFGLELLLAHSGVREDAVDILSDAVFFCLDGDELYPGAVMPGLVQTGHLKHLFFIPPPLWNGSLESIRIGAREVRFLEAIPISDEELAVAGTEGSEALAQLLEQEQIDIFDWSRPSVASL